MSDPIAINRLNWDERAVIHARDATGDYRLDRFRAGEDALHAIEAAELGDVAGKRVLHLQCHIGRDTLCLARRGAQATGLDFSGEALKVARALGAQTGLRAAFVQGTVDEAPRLTPGPFDLVFTTWGVLCWLPDMGAWARASRRCWRRAAKSIARRRIRVFSRSSRRRACSRRPMISARRRTGRCISPTRRPIPAIPPS